MTTKGQFILLAKSGALPKHEKEMSALRDLPHVLHQKPKQTTELLIAGKSHAIDVLHSISKLGPKLIEMDLEQGLKHSGKNIGDELRLYEVRQYQTASVGAEHIKPKDTSTDQLSSSDLIHLSVTIKDSQTGKPVVGANVIAYFDYASSKGSLPAVTNSSGVAQVLWLKSLPSISKLIVLPPEQPTYWGLTQDNVTVSSELSFTVEPVNPDYVDCVKSFYPDNQCNLDNPVTVAVVDTGVAAHTGLNLVGGTNTVQGEDNDDYGSNGDPHGTHVAGLVGANDKVRGAAPGVRIRSYRVFGEGEKNASSYAITQAVLDAAEQNCDIINLSLGVNENDTVLKDAIDHARSCGSLVVAAGNNNYGGDLGYPAAYPNCIGVSAMGKIGTIPDGAQPVLDITDERGTDTDDFLASFTSVGKGVDFIGPGVGAISTIPENTYGQLSGTSMACPLISGCAASLLANDTQLYQSKRDNQRSNNIESVLKSAASSLGFTASEQGDGIPITSGH